MTKIEWTDRTWNPVVGCTVASPGCDNCYAASVASRRMQPAHEGLTIGRQWNGEVRLMHERLDEPLRWRKPSRVFVCSMSDLFHPKVPTEFIAHAFATMERASAHTFQVLTKRPQRMAALIQSREFVAAVDDVRGAAAGDFEWPPDNVWLGVSVESEKYVWRAHDLRCTPAKVRFLSIEPLIGPIDTLLLDDIDWVIVGGESGPGARPMHPDWARRIRDICVNAGVAFFFKQWGEYGITGWAVGEHDGELVRMGKRNSGRELDGRTWDEFPATKVGAR